MAQKERETRLSRWILLPFALVAFVALAFLVRNVAGREMASSPSKDVSPSPSPWAAPSPSPSPSPHYTTCQPWSRCQDADWLKARLASAGIPIVGETGGALILEFDGLKLHAWTTPRRELSEGGYPLVGEVANTEVFGGGVQLTWEANEYRLWVSSAMGKSTLSVEQIKEVVKATLDS